MHNISISLAHGAGAGHSSDFMSQFAATIKRQLAVKLETFTFDYMSVQEQTLKRRPPPRFDKLVEEWGNALDNSDETILVGKSMGGRVATQLTALSQVKAVICIGFPFYPAGKPEKHRLSFLENLQVPCLIIQGSRDPLGNREWVDQQQLPQGVDLCWLEGADHDFKHLKKQQLTLEQSLQKIVQLMADWLAKQTL